MDELKMFCRKTKQEIPVPFEIEKDNIETVRQRFFRNAQGKSFEGCVVELKEPVTVDAGGIGGGSGTTYSVVNFARPASEIRRALGVITAQPEGTDPGSVFSGGNKD